jgi:hypothetical protein
MQRRERLPRAGGHALRRGGGVELRARARVRFVECRRRRRHARKRSLNLRARAVQRRLLTLQLLRPLPVRVRRAGVRGAQQQE